LGGNDGVIGNCLVLYFFFNTTNLSLSSIDSACQAFLSQIFQNAPDKKFFLDTASFTIMSAGQAQLKGTPAMIRELLLLSLSRHQCKHLVLDRPDECVIDADGMGLEFHEALEGSGTMNLIFSRPGARPLRRNDNASATIPGGKYNGSYHPSR